jgi:hypothetical protein
MEVAMASKLSHARRSRPAAPLLLALVLALGLAGAGCGDRNLILRVDLLSFLDPSETQGHYGPVPGGLSDSVTIVAARRVDLLPGLSDVTIVRDVALHIAGEFRNQTGSGSGTIKIYLSGPGTDPFTADTSPIVVPFAVAGADTDSVALVIDGVSELAGLFTGLEAQMGLRLTLTSDLGPEPLEGDFQLTQLLAVVTARRGEL